MRSLVKKINTRLAFVYYPNGNGTQLHRMLLHTHCRNCFLVRIHLILIAFLMILIAYLRKYAAYLGCCLCLVFAMLSCLFIAALWSPAGKGLTSWLSFVMFNCVFVTFPCGILGQVWYLIVLIPDLCHLSFLLSVPF